MNKAHFLILLEPDALDDIHSAINFNNQKQVGFGKRFEKKLIIRAVFHTSFSPKKWRGKR